SLAVAAAGPAAGVALAKAHKTAAHPTRHRMAAHRPAKKATKHTRASVKTAARRVGTKPATKPVAVIAKPAAPVSPRPVGGVPVTVSAFRSPSAPGASTPTTVAAATVTRALTTSTPAPASAWGEPALVNPITINVTPATNLALNQSQDYILQCPSTTLALTDTFKVWGGHNVVLQNCSFNLTIPGWAGAFKNQTGTLWMHDVHFGGIDLTGGLQLQEPGATVVMRDVLFDTVYGSYSTNHAELIQTWSGPARLMIDGLTGATTYQGLFLLPNQYNYSTGPAPTVFDFRNIDINDTQGAYAMWLGDVTGAPASNQAAGIATWNVSNVFVNPNPSRSWNGWWLWPKPSSGDPTWNKVTSGVPASESFVHATISGASGVDEGVSPTPLTGEQP
ncbi:MAG: hypothetical protein WBQ18_18250, partial [Solirubrobacteraceae bacterium]